MSVANRTEPVCICGKALKKHPANVAYSGNGIVCDGCNKRIKGKDQQMIYHCLHESVRHPKGYDLCFECGDKQLQFDELRGLLDEDKDYVLERDERYPVRVTLQYYKATDNGAVNREIMDDIVKQLEASQKQADFMGSLVTEYDPNRPTEWVDEAKGDVKEDDPIQDVADDAFAEIRAALQEFCGDDWKSYMENFENEDVKDSELKFVTNDDLKELIPKMGPRNRFRNWMEER